jgi:hypothetical protein
MSVLLSKCQWGDKKSRIMNCSGHVARVGEKINRSTWRGLVLGDVNERGNLE